MILRIHTTWLLWFFLFGGITLGVATFVYRKQYIQEYAARQQLSRYPGIEKSSGKLPAYVLSVSGTVEYQPPGSNEWITVTADTAIMEGAKVRTKEGGEVLLSVGGGQEAKEGETSQVSLRVTEQSELSLESSGSKEGGGGVGVSANVTKGTVQTTKTTMGKKSAEGVEQVGEVEVGVARATEEGGARISVVTKPATGAGAEQKGAETGAGANAALAFEQSPATGGDEVSLITVRFGLVAPPAGVAPGYDRGALRQVVMDALGRYVKEADRGNVGSLAQLLLNPIEQDRSGYGLSNIRAAVGSADLTFRASTGQPFIIHIERSENQWKVTRRGGQ